VSVTRLTETLATQESGRRQSDNRRELDRDNLADHRLWPAVKGWASELSLTAPDAISRASQPLPDISRQPKPASMQPGLERSSLFASTG
jgi:hypothetical protein